MNDPSEGKPVDTTRCRQFNLWDGMILIAAIAIGLAFGKRATWQDDVPGILRVLNAACICLDSLSVAVVLLRTRRPRPLIALIMLQPGVFACGTAVVCMVLSGIMGVLVGYDSVFTPMLLITATGGGVSSVWLMFWFGGLWKHEKGWLDGMGRFLGVCWILLWLLIWALALAWGAI